MEKVKKRLKFLDISRGIAIILMVCGHCDTSKKIDEFLGLFNMAVFIFISGYLFKNKFFANLKEMINYIIKKCKKLYFFYIKYEILFFLLKNIFIEIGFYNSNILYGDKEIKPFTSVSEILVGVIKILCGMGREPFCGAFWFIVTLIFTIGGYTLIKYFSDKQKIIKPNIMQKVLIIVAFIIGYVMQQYMNIPRLAPAFTLMIIFDFGNECYKTNKIRFDKFVLIPICFIILLILNRYGMVSVNANEYSNPIYFLICSFVGIYMIISLGKFLERVPKLNCALEYIGKHTLIIMAWHLISFKLTMIIQFIICKIDYVNLGCLTGYNNMNVWYLLYVLMGVTLPLFIEFYINKVKEKNIIKLKI